MRRYANIKKAREDEQQNQTTTNINYIKKFMSILKNIIKKSTYRQIQLKLNKINHQKSYGTSSKKVWKQIEKKNKNSKVKKFGYFFKQLTSK